MGRDYRFEVPSGGATLTLGFDPSFDTKKSTLGLQNLHHKSVRVENFGIDLLNSAPRTLRPRPFNLAGE